MNAADKSLIDAALSALPTLITYAVEKGWGGFAQKVAFAQKVGVLHKKSRFCTKSRSLTDRK